MAKAKTARPRVVKTPARTAKAKVPKPPQAAKPGKHPFAAIDPLPTDAWRLARIDPAIASSEQAAQLLGLGYPRMFLTTPGDFTGTAEQLRTLVSNTRIIPRGALSRVYTEYTSPELDASELVSAVSNLVMYSGNHFAMYALEALYGTTATATTIIDTLEALPKSRWTEESDDDSFLNTSGAMTIGGLDFLLWRVPAKTRDALQARLAKLFKRVSDTATYGPGAALDVVVNRRAGWERVHGDGPLDLSSLLHVTDAPAFVADKVLGLLKTLTPRDRQLFDLQLGVIGGPKVLAALKASVAKFPSFQRQAIAAQLALVAG